MPLSVDFDPYVNGWLFENWGETTEFTWDLYRDTYLGINPTHDCVEAPLDCGFYEIFKNCAQQGNCGGLSLLALALFKYSGYMGSCSPASFYTGGADGPDRVDLHRAINILQARQFSVSGIENFIDMVDAGNLNDAVAAYNKVQECLGRNDYAVLSIAKGLFGDAAHTVIPYKCYTSGGTRYLEIWDSNYPADDNPSHYGSANARMVINGPTDWQYYPNPGEPGSTPYQGSDNGWCFTVPMSIVLPKDRQPFTLDFAFDAIQTAFLSGPGAAVSQISDGQGHQFYTSDAELHLSRNAIESDPAKRLKGVGRWPWYARTDSKLTQPGELYFIRGVTGRSALHFTVSGSTYKFNNFLGRNLLELEVSSDHHLRDIIKISPPAYGKVQTIEIKSVEEERVVNVRALRAGDEPGAWRSVEIKNARLSRNAIKIDITDEPKMIQIGCSDKKLEFNLDLQERKNSRIVKKTMGRLAIKPAKPLRVDLMKRKIF